ncbi:MAG: sodium:solute symporter family protein [Acidobacteriota bacterium]|nr:sodium:solute symporter family protein [Acidobacteriota bacterium]
MNLLPPEISEIVLANYGLIIATLVAYFVVFLVITWMAKRQLVKETGDYIVASRNLGWIVVTFTMYATVLSGVGMAGIPGTIYVVGAPFVVTALSGIIMAVALLWYFGPRIWVLGKEYNLATPGDLLGGYYQSDTIRIYTVIASVLYNVAYIVAQLLAGGILLNVLSGNVISFNLGVLIITVVVMLHVVSAGLRGIAWLDSFNGVLIVFLLVLFGFAIMAAGGGVSGVIAGLGGIRDRFISIPGMIGIFTPSRIYGVAIGLSIGSLVLSPSAWIRMYSARGKDQFKKVGVLLLGLWVLSHVIGTFLIGVYGRIVFPEVGNPDFISSLLAVRVLPMFFAALFLIAVLAAIISTADTYMHTLTATVVRDFIKPIMWSNMDDSQEFRLNRLIIIGVAIVGVLLALTNPVLITPLAIFAGGITVQLLPALVGAVTWSRASTPAALISTGVGMVLTLVWELGLVSNPLHPSVLPGLATAFFINVFLFVVISYMTRPPSPEQIDKYHGLLARKI